LGSNTSGERRCDKEHSSVLNASFSAWKPLDVGVLRSPEEGLVMRLWE
jgi:hypothetical protein